jgi:hypothetical protein
MTKKTIQLIQTIDREIELLNRRRSDLVKLQEKKKELEASKNIIPLEKLKQYAITDNCNIWGIFPFVNRDSCGQDTFKLGDEEFKLFKEIDTITSSGFGKDERTIFSKTKVSREYLEKAKDIADILQINGEPRIYLVTKDNAIVEDRAVIMTIGNLCFMFAPRVG